MFLLIAFSLTVIIEGIVIELIYSFFNFGLNRLKVFYFSFLCNLLTNPALNLIAALFKIRFPHILILEVLVVTIEGFIYNLLTNRSKKACFILSFILNGCSYFIGFILF